jgi:hypothetical protein
MNEPSELNRGWRIMRRILIAVAILVTLIAAFYTEEDWRGKRAWENCKSELEAQGVELDWNKFLPPNVPDDQNFYTASTNILMKFKFKQAEGFKDPDFKAALANSWLHLQVTSCPTIDSMDGRLIVARITLVSKAPVNVGQGTNILVVNLNDPTAAGRVRDLIGSVIGPSIDGTTGIKFYRNQLKNIRPARIYAVAAMAPSYSALEQMVPSGTRLQLTDADADAISQESFNVQWVHIYPIRAQTMEADDYLKWSDQFVPAFNEIREALNRPYAILPGDYSNPAFMPIPNFVVIRMLAQTLAQRAQCDLLLGQPDQALHELTLIHDVRRILEKPPTGRPETLIEAMINVAITGLYVQVIADGLQRHAWQEPQLIALQEQLKETDLCPFVFEGCREEPAHISRVAEMATPPVWESFRPFRWAIPRGWLYQMMVVAVKLECKTLPDVDLENNAIAPKKLDDTMNDIDKSLNRRSPFNLLARIVIPNFVNAWQATAYKQTLVNEGQIACALERYRLAHGEYPETLDALTPRFIESIPHDLIGGQPLHYRPTPDGKFLLYSVGWNETDDGGNELPHWNNGHGADYSKGDWVWEN